MPLFVSLEEFEKYCYDIANTTAWGGQLEVSILTLAFLVSNDWLFMKKITLKY